MTNNYINSDGKHVKLLECYKNHHYSPSHNWLPRSLDVNMLLDVLSLNVFHSGELFLSFYLFFNVISLCYYFLKLIQCGGLPCVFSFSSSFRSVTFSVALAFRIDIKCVLSKVCIFLYIFSHAHACTL